MTRRRGGRITGIFRYFEETVAGVALLVLVATVCFGVVTRYVTATSAAWTGDVTSVAFAWLIFVGGAAGFKYRMHMSIDLVWALLPAAVQRYFGALVDMIVLAFLAYATWLGVGFCLETMDDPLPILRWPRAVLYAAVMVGFGCMFLRYLTIAWRRFQGDTEPSHHLGDATGGDAKWT
jgi:TRAP-type C4-dicarboxylate transport system permease small subunit